MSSSYQSDLKGLVADAVRAAGFEWRSLAKRAEQIIVFGSYALRANTDDSDLDVLCIGEGKRFKSKSLHVIWIPSSRLSSPLWSGSELATHVAAYGQWIKGRNTWAFSKVPSIRTVEQKRERVLKRAVALARHWNDLLPSYQTRQLQKIRRDVQRFLLLREGKPSSPKPILDSEWNVAYPKENWAKLLKEAPEFAPYLRPLISRAATQKPKKVARS